MEHLVSIIIPTYNRAHLIAETLDSIIAQTYANWECVVIDDGSIDDTEELMESYTQKDSRIQYYKRPNDRIKGANSCRNYGFELSKGYYVKWFDSDDIMLAEHVTILVDALQKKHLDFVVGDTLTFEEGKDLSFKPYKFDRQRHLICPFLFATNQIGWITDDFLGKRSTLLNLKFNEELIDGQEYNFFIRYLLTNNKGAFVNEILTRMRVHPQSLGVVNRMDKLNHKKTVANIKILTLEDIFVYKNKSLNDWFIMGYTHISFDLALNGKISPSLLKGVWYMVRLKNNTKAILFLLSIITGLCFKTGYTLNKYSRN